MKDARYLAVFVILTLALRTVQTRAESLQVVGPTYSYSWQRWASPDPWPPTYSGSGPSPVEAEDVFGDVPGAAETFVRGTVGESSVLLDVSVHWMMRGNSTAQVDWRPTANTVVNLILDTVRSGGDSAWHVVLVDTTTATTLFDRYYDGGPSTATYGYPFSVKATDVYRLTTTAYGLGGDIGAVRSLVVIPKSQPPVADPGGPYTVACGPGQRMVQLDGAGSTSSISSEPLRYSWNATCRGLVMGEPYNAKSELLLWDGTSCEVTLTVIDSFGALASAATTVTAVDTEPPTFSVSASPAVLKTPNHKMVPVTLNVTAEDACDPAPVCRIVSVSSNEPINGVGDGDTSPDWQVSGPLGLALRAERSGTGSGRVYTVKVACVDASGNSSTKTVTVSVPKGQR